MAKLAAICTTILIVLLGLVPSARAQATTPHPDLSQWTAYPRTEIIGTDGDQLVLRAVGDVNAKALAKAYGTTVTDIRERNLGHTLAYCLIDGHPWRIKIPYGASQKEVEEKRAKNGLWTNCPEEKDQTLVFIMNERFKVKPGARSLTVPERLAVFNALKACVAPGCGDELARRAGANIPETDAHAFVPGAPATDAPQPTPPAAAPAPTPEEPSPRASGGSTVSTPSADNADAEALLLVTDERDRLTYENEQANARAVAAEARIRQMETELDKTERALQTAKAHREVPLIKPPSMEQLEHERDAALALAGRYERNQRIWRGVAGSFIVLCLSLGALWVRTRGWEEHVAPVLRRSLAKAKADAEEEINRLRDAWTQALQEQAHIQARMAMRVAEQAARADAAEARLESLQKQAAAEHNQRFNAETMLPWDDAEAMLSEIQGFLGLTQTEELLLPLTYTVVPMSHVRQQILALIARDRAGRPDQKAATGLWQLLIGPEPADGIPPDWLARVTGELKDLHASVSEHPADVDTLRNRLDRLLERHRRERETSEEVLTNKDREVGRLEAALKNSRPLDAKAPVDMLADSLRPTPLVGQDPASSTFPPRQRGASTIPWPPMSTAESGAHQLPSLPPGTQARMVEQNRGPDTMHGVAPPSPGGITPPSLIEVMNFVRNALRGHDTRQNPFPVRSLAELDAFSGISQTLARTHLKCRRATGEPLFIPATEVHLLQDVHPLPSVAA